MDPADIIAQALHDVWQPVDDAEQFPSRKFQASFIVRALHDGGVRLVSDDDLGTLLERLEARLKGRPAWTDDYDPLVAFALKVLGTSAED